MSKSKSEKKLEETQSEETEKPKKKGTEKAFLFPSVTVNGKQGISIMASTQEEALNKLNKILNVKQDD